MSHSTTFGRTITGGIQDISALLPLLGTEQCEQHVGSALDKGFLYSSATPISIFGSLGIVRASFKILLANINVQGFQFLGAKALNDAGFSLTGTTARLIGLDSKVFPVEPTLEPMLAEEGVDNIVENLTVSFGEDFVKWNIKVVFSTLFVSLAGLLPYVIVIRDLGDASHKHFFPLGFGFPILRVFGSAICVIAAQLLIQLRIVVILKTKLFFIIVNRLAKSHDIEDLASVIRNGLKPEANPNEVWSPELPAERSVWNLLKWLASHDSDAEAARIDQKVAETFKSQYRKQLGPADTQIRLWAALLCFLLATGCFSTIVGYVGCFFLIQNSSSSAGTLIWLAVEAALSLLRIIIWAANPPWDDSKGIRYRLHLCPHPPMVTTDKSVNDILSQHTYAPLTPQVKFLEDLSSSTGPIRPLVIPNTEFGYIISFDAACRRSLLVVLSYNNHVFGVHGSWILFKDSPSHEFSVSACTLHNVPRSSNVNVKVMELALLGRHPHIWDWASEAKIAAHYDEIHSKLQENKLFIRRTWTMSNNHQLRMPAPQNRWERQILTANDKAYLSHCLLQQIRCDASSVFEHWIDAQVGIYVPALLDIRSSVDGQAVAPESLSALQQFDALEKAMLRLQCQKFFEYHLLSFATQWDDGVKKDHVKFLGAISNTSAQDRRDSTAIETHRSQMNDSSTRKLEFFLEEQVITRRENSIGRIRSHESAFRGGPASDEHKSLFGQAVSQLVEAVPLLEQVAHMQNHYQSSIFLNRMAIRLRDAHLFGKQEMFENRVRDFFTMLEAIDTDIRGFLDGPEDPDSRPSIKDGADYISALESKLKDIGDKWRRLVRGDGEQV